MLERGSDGRARIVDGHVGEVAEPGGVGELALRSGWPSMFRTYLNDDAQYRTCFTDGWYLTGDLARRDADGYFWFVGRADDVIKSAGHLIGPFEVESILMEHPAVAEAGAIGKPDPVAGEIVKAFVTLQPGYQPGEDVRRRAHRVRPSPPRRAGTSGDRLRSAPSAHSQRQDNAAATQSPGAGTTRGRPFDSGGGAVTKTTRPTRKPRPRAGSAPDQRLELLRQMLRIRRFEERCVELYSATKIRGFLHLCIGEEAVAVGALQPLAADDAVVATYREHGHALARGMSMTAVLAEMFGKQTGCSRGRGGSMHLFDSTLRFYGGNAIVGGGLPLAIGLALADKMRGKHHVTACLFGDGAWPRASSTRALTWPRCGTCPSFLLREQRVRDGHGAGSRARADRPGAAGCFIRHGRRGRWTGWMSWPCSMQRGVPWSWSGTAVDPASWNCAPTGSGRTRCMTRSGTATRPRWRSGESATRSQRSRRPLQQAGALTDADLRRIGNRDCRGD